MEGGTHTNIIILSYTRVPILLTPGYFRWYDFCTGHDTDVQDLDNYHHNNKGYLVATRKVTKIIVICISVIDQGDGPIKLFILYIVLRVYIYFHPGYLLATVEVIGSFYIYLVPYIQTRPIKCLELCFHTRFC